jgi:acetyl esterase/lipase/peptidoglycan/xylan/chitin deacetylase (PgdA/CDA1 family)
MLDRSSVWLFLAFGSLLAGSAWSSEAVLQFTIGMHIEPFGTTEQGFRSPFPLDYRQPMFFARQVEDIQAVARIVEKHGGRLTIQAQSPFTSVAVQSRNTVLAELAARGHEIALHFHEDAHLGPNFATLPVERWCSVLREEIRLIQQAAPAAKIRYWSGGNTYPELYKAATCAGLEVNSDWKDPRNQSSPHELLGVNPWRPAGGTDGVDFSLFTRHDPSGPVVFLPEGQFDRTDFASMRRSENAGGDAAYFEYLGRMLIASVEAAQKDRVNVFHFTVHPGEFRGDGQQPFAVIERLLTDVVDPLVASGKVRWATLGQMGDSFASWEHANPGVEPRKAMTSNQAAKRGYMTFAVNSHDWTHGGESAQTLTRLVDLFEKYQVRGDFYFTAELTRKLATEHPEVIERLRKSNMTISYHTRPPHPAYPGFDRRLNGLDDAALRQALLDAETYRLDPATAELDRSQPGGYRYVAQVFGRMPVVASAPNPDPRIRDAQEQIYAWLGAKVTVRYHEEGTAIDKPFEFVNDLLVRPSDFSITRVTLDGGRQNFWWNLTQSADSERFRPVRLLEERLADWERRSPGRLPLITALIHDNNFARSGPEGWSSIYFTMIGGERGDPLPPPYDLRAPDPSRLRSGREQAAIWAAYEEMVAFAARELTVVTSEDLLRLASGGSGNSIAPSVFDPAKLGATQRDVPYCRPGGSPLRMDVYYPRTADGRWPGVVFVHGGGWTGGDKSQVGPEGPALRDAGFLVFSVNYRLGPQHRFPAMIEDVKCAVRFLRANAASFNLDPERIGAWGSSAGGHLAALLGMADASAGFDVGEYSGQSSRVRAVSSFYGPMDFTVAFAGGHESKPEVFGGYDPVRASPISYASAGDPPFLFVHGDSDQLVPLSQSERMHAKLQQVGVPSKLVAVANANHGLTPLTGTVISPSRQEVTRTVVEFFQKELGPR